MARVETFYCSNCEDIVTADRLDHKLKCKGSKKSNGLKEQPASHPPEQGKPEQESSNGLSKQEPFKEPSVISQVERNKRYRDRNPDQYREYMKDYMRRKRKQAREQRAD